MCVSAQDVGNRRVVAQGCLQVAAGQSVPGHVDHIVNPGHDEQVTLFTARMVA